MAYVDKINVDGINYDIGSKLSEIRDNNGNQRFIEGNIATDTISGVSFTYAKWSLSGSHLMLVIAGTIAAGTTISNATQIGFAQLPEWIRNKIYPIGTGVVADVIGYQTFTLVGVGSWSRVSQEFYSWKGSQGVGINKSGSLTVEEDLYFRLQFDLLIDND